MKQEEHFDPMSHLVPVSLYVAIWAALMIFTGLTVFAARLELHVFNIVVALLIATIKGTLVVLFFMHLRYSTKLTMVTVVAAMFFLFLLLGLTMTDYLTRGMAHQPRPLNDLDFDWPSASAGRFHLEQYQSGWARVVRIHNLRTARCAPGAKADTLRSCLGFHHPVTEVCVLYSCDTYT